MKNKVNDKQIQFVRDVRSGKVEIPQDKDKAADLLGYLLLLRDYEVLERGLIDRSKLQALKIIDQTQGRDGWVYVSYIKTQLMRRAYFKELNESTTERGIDAIRVVVREMIKDGLISTNNLEAMITTSGKEYLNSKEAF